jgi:hypothetical protein
MSLNLNLKRFDPKSMEKRRINPNQGPPTCVVVGKRGTGKCLSRDTPIIMYNGNIKMVQDIKIGELVMGDDSTPRKVLGTTTGKSEMYKIKQNKGDDYTVNEHHILSLKVVATNTVGRCINIQGKKCFRGDIIDIKIQDYLKLSKTTREAKLKGYKKSITFPEKKVPFDPYLLGLWLGDGSSVITNQDSTIIKYLIEKLPDYNCYLGLFPVKKDSNYFLKHLKELNLLNNKHIPHNYLCNSRENRLKLLAGLLDTDGKCNNFEICQKNNTLAKDIEFLSRSLGFTCNMKKSKRSCPTKNGTFTGIYNRMHISGKGIDEIPCLIPRKKAKEYSHNKDSLVTGIKIENIGIGDYYGFELNGNHRFLLGDTTVSHNSHLIADLLYHFRKIPSGMIMSGTEAGCNYFGKFFPSSFIYDDFYPEKVSELVDEQRKMAKRKNLKGDNSALLLLEDCMYDKKSLKCKDIRGIFMNGRHWKILFMLSMQYCMDILPELRSNIDYVFVLRENFLNIRKKLYDNFFGILPTFDTFNQVMDVVTADYGCLVLDNTSKSNKIEDCLFWYKAKPVIKDYKIGCKDLWDYHNKNFKEGGDVEKESLDKMKMKNKNKPTVQVHKVKNKQKKKNPKRKK